MRKESEARLREVAPAARGRQDAVSRNLPFVFYVMSVNTPLEKKTDKMACPSWVVFIPRLAMAAAVSAQSTHSRASPFLTGFSYS